MTPSEQLKTSIVQALKTAGPSWTLAMPAAQIRGTLDLSGDPKGLAGIAVSVADMGGYDGMPSRALITCDARVRVFTHLEDDIDGADCAAYSAQAMDTLSSASHSLSGWLVNGTSGWKLSDATMGGSYRILEVTTTFYIQQYTPSSSATSTTGD